MTLNTGPIDMFGVFLPIEHWEFPFAKGLLTTNGIQWSTALTTSTDIYEVVEAVTITPPSKGLIYEVMFSLTAQTKSSAGGAEDVNFKWQASDDNATWVDLCAEQTHAADASAYASATLSGSFLPATGFLNVPFYLRFVIKSSGAGGETAIAQTKNSSWVKVRYIPQTG